ncbi:prolipoprotein diacylglyceryl transferase [Patescibacteria group bacterium]|nr:prolipoprotein diacylglyceryl transferase [Patescibacteria group bacterium]
MWYHSIQTFDLFGITVQVWGLMLAVGVILGWYLVDYNLWWRQIKHDTSWVVLCFVFSAIVGARLVHVLIEWDSYRNNLWSVLAVWQGGMASYGAIIFGFGFLAIYIFKRVKERADFWDAAVTPLFLTLFLARTGCFMINDHLGKIANLPWSIVIWGESRHPISLYYMLIALFMFALSSWLYYQNLQRGRLIWLGLGVYALLRVLVDVVAKDFEGNMDSWYVTVWGGALMILVAGVLWMKSAKR